MNDSGGRLGLLLLDHSFLGLGPGRGRVVVVVAVVVGRESDDLAFQLVDPAVGVGVLGLEFADPGDQNFSLAPERVHLQLKLFRRLKDLPRLDG